MTAMLGEYGHSPFVSGGTVLRAVYGILHQVRTGVSLQVCWLPNLLVAERHICLQTIRIEVWVHP